MNMHVLAALLEPELTDRLQKRETLDIADGTADLGDEHVDVVLRRADAVLDLVRDVRDDLHGASRGSRRARSFAMTELVDLAGRVVGRAW